MSWLQSARETAGDFIGEIDSDHDGAVLDDVADNVGTWLPSATGALIGTALGGKAGAVTGGAAGRAVGAPFGAAAHVWGDEMSDLAGARDMSAEHAGEHGQGLGAATRAALDPGVVGHGMAGAGEALGGYVGTLGGLPFGGPVGMMAGGMAGSTAGAVAGMAVGSQIDHGIEHLVDAYHHWTD